MPKCCKQCGSAGVTTILLDEYVDPLMGAPFEVVLEKAVTETRCAKCGARLGVTIPDGKGLMAAVAMTRALDPFKLLGEEIRFLRKAVGWKGKDLAKILEITAEHLSRCEKGAPNFLSPGLEKYLRHFACEKIKESYAPAIQFNLSHFERMRIMPVRDATQDGGLRRYRFRRVRFVNEQKYVRREAKAA
jgi:transcriptional regulator with XRE-family HTH domain